MKTKNVTGVRNARRITLTRSRSVVPVLSLLLCAAVFSAGCPKGTQSLATASDTIAHALANAQQAVAIGVSDGVVAPKDAAAFNEYAAKVAQAGLVLDGGIRANVSATNLSQEVNSFLDAFNALNTQGLLSIKNQNVQLAVSTALAGAESAVAIIAATVHATPQQAVK